MAEFIVGTVLAVLPLVLEGFGAYTKMAGQYKTFMRYSSELRELDGTLRAQKCIVQETALQLFESICGDSNTARELMSGGEPALLNGLEISDARLSQLVEMWTYFELWNEALWRVKSAIDSIGARLESLKPQPDQKARELGDSIRQFKRKLTLALTKAELKRLIQDLRESVADFRTLNGQIRERLESGPSGKSSRGQPAQEAPKLKSRSLEIYHRIQAVSSKLYDMIHMHCSCATPHRHLASIGLLDKDALEKGLQGAVFSIAISSLQSNSTLDKPIILEVELVKREAKGVAKSDGPVMGTIAATEVRQSAVMNALFGRYGAVPNINKTSAQDTDSVMSKRPLSIESRDARGLLRPHSFQRPSIVGNVGIPKSIEITKDLCQQLREMVWSGQTSGMWIRGADDHSFELRPHKQGPSGTHRSLAEIISTMSPKWNETRHIPRASLANLAGSLAHAVLQYHSTPWLLGTWKSHDVAFFDSAEHPDATETRSLSSPYLMTELFDGPLHAAEQQAEEQARAQSEPPPTPDQLRRSESLSAGTARNEMLFHLGVVLLELGFGRPWPELRGRAIDKLLLPPPREQDRQQQQQQYPNSRVAERLAQDNELRDRMGLNYCRIVRKCLACDFGLGEDNFGDPELQGAFLVDVVMALERAEQALRKLDT